MIARSAAGRTGGGLAGTERACDRCLAHSWLLARLTGHLDVVRARIGSVLGLPEEELIEALAGRHRTAVTRELRELDVGALREGAAGAELQLICRCDPRYPARLAVSPSGPAVLHVAGDLERFLELLSADPVAIVGARRPSAYGLEFARSLGHGLGCAGITVLSGMALGIDAAAHSGALAAGAATVAVLPGGADRPYPPSKHALHRQIFARGAAVSELPAGTKARRWTFPARNRIIAGLSAMTIVVEAGARSGALITAEFARDLRRGVGAVPGRVSSPLSCGPNGLLASGAHVVRGPQDVLDQLFGAGVRAAQRPERPELTSELHVLLTAVADGDDTTGALARAGFPVEHSLAALAALVLSPASLVPIG